MSNSLLWFIWGPSSPVAAKGSLLVLQEASESPPVHSSLELLTGMGRCGRTAQLLVLHVDHSQASVPYCLSVTGPSALLCVWWPGLNAPLDTFMQMSFAALELGRSSCLTLTFLLTMQWRSYVSLSPFLQLKMPPEETRLMFHNGIFVPDSLVQDCKGLPAQGR